MLIQGMKTRSVWMTLLILAGLFLVGKAEATAADPSFKRTAVESACKSDIENFCKGISVGGGRIARCLKENESKLSPGCKVEIEEKLAVAKEKGAGFKQECEANVQEFCSGIQPGGGRIIRCLKQNQSKLAKGCQDALAQMKQ
jgi:hypothetical protein